MDETVPRDPPTPSAAPARAARPAGMLLASRAAIGSSAALIAETRAGFHQRQVDMEVAATRRQLLRMAEHRDDGHRLGVLDPDFLAVADAPALLEAILRAAFAFGRADACDLQLLDRRTRSLRIVASRGFEPAFLDHFASVTPGQRTACAGAVTTGRPVVVPDVASSPLFAGTDNLGAMLDAGSRSVRSHPLLDTSGVPMGVLSFHYRQPLDRLDETRSRPDLVSRQAALALECLTDRHRPAS